MTTAPGPFITDHRVVISTLNVKSSQPKRQQIKVRKLNAVETTQWEKEFNHSNVHTHKQSGKGCRILGNRTPKSAGHPRPCEKLFGNRLGLRNPGSTRI